jgi:hypothetical protein
MVVRSDIIFNWAASPRIITVLAPSTEITIQDLLDTCREAEDDLQNLIYSQIASASGKENLGGGTLVGLTVKLLDAVLAFEARPGPTYTQCRVSGGNLVAINFVGSDISPIYPTAFTQILTTSSSSATLQELDDIQYSSFNGGVSVNLTSIYSGTTYPKGTPRQPVNNFVDALSIANSRGFINFYIIGNATIIAGSNYSNKNFIGESENRTTLTIDSGANVINCGFTDATIQGILDGGSNIKSCNILNLNYVDGHIINCVLSGTIILGGNAHILNCYSGIPGASTPIIDFNNSSSALSLRNYNGGITLINKGSSESISIDLNSGQVILDSTITAGTIIIRGIGKLTDNSAGATIDATHLLSPENITKTVWNEPKADHTIPGTLGKEVATNANVIAAAIVFK